MCMHCGSSYLSWVQVSSQAEAAGTHGLPTEARTPASLFKPHLQEDLRAGDTRSGAVTNCYLVKFSSDRWSIWEHP